MIGTLVAVLVLVAVGGFYLILRLRNIDIWFAAYLKDEMRMRRQPAAAHTHVYFCFVDHYEPYGYGAQKPLAQARLQKWLDAYPTVARRHADSDGRVPQHSYFYPEEEYDADILQSLAELCRAGYGDVEVHLHHDHDTAAGVRAKLLGFKETLARDHGLLHRDARSGEVVYGFIHGNWALDNSRPDGRWCGVDDELSVLKETGCYADFTLPSAPSDTQTRKINSIYFAKGRPGRRKSHDTGVDVRVGYWDDEALLMIQGPLTLNWGSRKFGLIPRVESAELSYEAPPTAARVRLWRRCGVCVKGAENHVFIKVHTHGATESAIDMLFEQGGFDLLWTELERQYRDAPAYSLHYVTAWEMYNKVKSLAQGR